MRGGYFFFLFFGQIHLICCPYCPSLGNYFSISDCLYLSTCVYIYSNTFLKTYLKVLLLIFFFIISGLHDYVHMADAVCTAEFTEMPASAVLLSSVDLYDVFLLNLFWLLGL